MVLIQIVDFGVNNHSRPMVAFSDSPIRRAGRSYEYLEESHFDDLQPMTLNFDCKQQNLSCLNCDCFTFLFLKNFLLQLYNQSSGLSFYTFIYLLYSKCISYAFIFIYMYVYLYRSVYFKCLNTDIDYSNKNTFLKC